ncbi:MAG: hypothetical protein KJ804_21505 [Proteobacteria bacterium]|nr:hypothetical protein [Pseudomonadota bacterium]MBU1060888.1 hypothetical protein [Pseudomonadota bacterium]
MYDRELLSDKLNQVSDTLDRIPRRFAEINCADNFLANDHGLDMLDSVFIIQHLNKFTTDQIVTYE